MLITDVETTLLRVPLRQRTITDSQSRVEAVDFLQVRLDTDDGLAGYGMNWSYTPGLRAAQKYAVTCGGCQNHRMGLYDAILIKENHILAAGSIAVAVEQARFHSPGFPVEIEVETLEQLEEAVAAGVDRVLLDNFKPDQIRQAVDRCQGKIPLEASGGITLENIREYADTGVDYLSTGSLTKDIIAIDLSMRFSM